MLWEFQLSIIRDLVSLSLSAKPYAMPWRDIAIKLYEPITTLYEKYTTKYFATTSSMLKLLEWDDQNRIAIHITFPYIYYFIFFNHHQSRQYHSIFVDSYFTMVTVCNKSFDKVTNWLINKNKNCENMFVYPLIDITFNAIDTFMSYFSNRGPNIFWVHWCPNLITCNGKHFSA